VLEFNFRKVEVFFELLVYSTTPLIRTLVTRVANHPEWLSHSGKFVESFAKLICLEITGYRIE
jgi:hypothetical protein